MFRGPDHFGVTAWPTLYKQKNDAYTKQQREKLDVYSSEGKFY